jgi:predicted enzyme related to lactoylglutathione lyase
MNYNPVGWFEIPVNDLERAQKFYEAVLSIKMESHPELNMVWFPMHQDAKGVSGALMKYESYIPSHEGPILYFTAPNLDDAIERVEKNGGKILNPKTDIGEYGWVAHFEDSEGNRVALHKAKS